jgi:hypothetical protein
VNDVDGIWLKVQWANKHIDELHSVLNAFIASKPYGISCKIKPDTGHRVYYVAKADPIPQDVPLIISDVLQNLRTALDYLLVLS